MEHQRPRFTSTPPEQPGRAAPSARWRPFVAFIGGCAVGCILPFFAYAEAMAAMLGVRVMGRRWTAALMVLPTAAWLWLHRDSGYAFTALSLLAQLLAAAVVASLASGIHSHRMSRARWGAMALGAILVALLLATYRSLQCLPMGGGREQTSPSGQYIAKVYDQSQDLFWGGDRDWTECSIVTKTGSTLWRSSFEHTGGDLDWRSGGDIRWADDSSRAVFRYRRQTAEGGTLTLEIRSPHLPPGKVEKK